MQEAYSLKQIIIYFAMPPQIQSVHETQGAKART